MKETAEIGTAT